MSGVSGVSEVCGLSEVSRLAGVSGVSGVSEVSEVSDFRCEMNLWWRACATNSPYRKFELSLQAFIVPRRNLLFDVVF